MTPKDYFTVGIASCSLIISIIGLLWGNNLLDKVGNRVDAVEQKTEDLNEKLVAIADPSKAPNTEKQVVVTTKNKKPNKINLASMNITLTDDPQQKAQVEDWLLDANSGYPALVAAIVKLMDNHHLKGNAVPLIIINKENLRLHGRPTNQLFIDADEMNKTKLKQAIFLSWKQKNSSSPLRDFKEIIE